jgi:type II secretory pathway pseudopilin PulG
MLSMKRAARGKRTAPSPSIIRASDGMTLLELIVAFVVLMIALVTFAQFMTKALTYSRSVRRAEMAQMLAQAQMEQLTRKLSAEGITLESGEEGGPTQFFGEGPAPFEDLADARGEDLSPFMWVADAEPSANDPKLANVTLYVYTVSSRLKENSALADDVYVSDDRERFTITHALADGSTEVLYGREQFTLSSAVALP